MCTPDTEAWAARMYAGCMRRTRTAVHPVDWADFSAHTLNTAVMTLCEQFASMAGVRILQTVDRWVRLAPEDRACSIFMVPWDVGEYVARVATIGDALSHLAPLSSMECRMLACLREACVIIGCMTVITSRLTTHPGIARGARAHNCSVAVAQRLLAANKPPASMAMLQGLARASMSRMIRHAYGLRDSVYWGVVSGVVMAPVVAASPPWMATLELCGPPRWSDPHASWQMVEPRESQQPSFIFSQWFVTAVADAESEFEHTTTQHRSDHHPEDAPAHPHTTHATHAGDRSPWTCLQTLPSCPPTRQRDQEHGASSACVETRGL